MAYNQLLESVNTNTGYLREKRNKVFKAFDIYKQNVSYGLVTETKAKHNEITEWYQSCLDLDPEAINNIPDEIKPFLEKINF